jgi:hypothetical protein
MLPPNSLRYPEPEENYRLMDELALHVRQGQCFVDPSPDWHGSTMIPDWQRDGARDSACSIASCFRQSATSRAPDEVRAHTSNATPYFGSPAFTWSGAETPCSEPDLHRCYSVRFSVFILRCQTLFDPARILRFLQYADSGLDEQSFAVHSNCAPSAVHAPFPGDADGTRRTARVTRTKKEHAELIAVISRERIQELMHIPQKEAARQCGVCVTTFKKIYRGYVTPPRRLCGAPYLALLIYGSPLRAVRTVVLPLSLLLRLPHSLRLCIFRVSRNGLAVNSGASTPNTRGEEISRCLRLTVQVTLT